MTDISIPMKQAGQKSSALLLPARYALVGLLVVVILVLSYLRPSFADPGNINLVLRTIGISMIMFLGLTWVIASGKIDVSFMDVAALSTMVVAITVTHGYGWGLAVLGGLATGAFIGFINGLLVGYVGMPPLITTIATGTTARSIAWVMGAGASMPIDANGFVNSFLGTNLGVVPMVTVMSVLLYVVAWFFQQHLVFGQYIYSMEQNEQAVVEAGITSRKLTAILFVISGVCASLAGVLLSANLASGQPGLGASYFLDGLTAVLLGGMVIKFGKPNVFGTFIGVAFLAVLVSGGAMLGWSNYVREIIKGCLLLAGVTIVLTSRSWGKSAGR